MAQTWRERQKTQLRERIYEIALDLFQSGGFGDTTVQQITERAGVAKGTFFNHFPSKEHVLAEWYRRLTFDALEEARGGKHAGAEAAILALMDALARRATQETKLIEMKARNQSDLLVDEERTLDGELRVFCIEQVEEGKKTREFSADVDETQFANLIVTTLTGTGRAWVLANHGFDLREALREHVGFLFRAARPASRRVAKRS
jgi:AcrR family transcriptional regulator